jgi:hypothetical protein
MDKGGRKGRRVKKTFRVTKGFKKGGQKEEAWHQKAKETPTDQIVRRESWMGVTCWYASSLAASTECNRCFFLFYR